MTQKAASLTTDHSKTTCITCGNPIQGNYCPRCGEKKFDHHDLTLKHLAEESFEGFTHFDNKFFKSAKLLITKPGLLSLEFCRGKRMPYMRPFALFLVCNVLFFLLTGKNNFFALSLSSFYNYEPYTYLNTQEIVNHLVKNNNEFIAAANIFQPKMVTDSKTFVVLFIPIFALCGLIQRKRLFAEHLIFSTHFFSFLLLFFTLLTTCISVPYYYLFSNGVQSSTYDLTSFLCSMIVLGIYYAIAVKRFYKASTFRAVMASVIMSIVFVISVYGYRMILFYKIIHTIHI